MPDAFSILFVRVTSPGICHGTRAIHPTQDHTMNRTALSVVLILVSALFTCTSFAAEPTPPPRTITVVDMTGDWEAAGDLPRQALVLSLQGLANRDSARIYALYPETHVHAGTKPILEFYRTRHNLHTVTMASVEELVGLYRAHLKGYVIWDTTVVPSLMVAFTIAGVEDALVVTAAQLPLMQRLGIPPVIDLRERFRGQTDAAIFQWAYDQYWSRCSRDILVYLGEHCRGLKNGPGMRPAIADFAVANRAFCSDLSARPGAGAEYALAERIMSEMNRLAYVYGWHSYCKDKEEEHITMVSRHALVMAEGLATVPNMSFHHGIPLSPDFRFVQKATYDPNPRVADKVYITLIESDGLGIGSWNKPGRGTIPYGWEMNEEYFTTAPALLQYYYETATDKDYFIGSLSGPGYFYPKYFPPALLPAVLRREDTLMRRMDLQVFGIMDFSEGDHAVGNADLTKDVVDAYYANMPSALGYLNGYGPANTYDCRHGRPLISYNYYVDVKKSVEEVAEDIRELARINPRRPYFLPVHVREDNNVERMKQIADLLGQEFVIVNPPEFMIMAGKRPTMTTRFLDRRPDFSGHWKLDHAASRNVFPSSYDLDVDHRGGIISITTTAREARYVHHRELRTTKTLIIGGPAVTGAEEVTRRMGYSSGWSDTIRTSARWNADASALLVKTVAEVETSQGSHQIVTEGEYTLSIDLMTLTVKEWRTTRTDREPVTVYVYRRVL
jgi:hypothetical protein